ncbi:MAG TPA: glycosyltransferase family 4 protein [Aggregatilineaceae bacterium]|nr:glycosyltransferase family 4 protein [Aggregatilineaceae bacterium]
MRRLLILSTEFPPGPGGIGTHAYKLGEQLQRLGWTVTVITRQDYVSAEEAEQFNAQQTLTIIRLRPVALAPLDAVYRRQLAARMLRRQKPDLILATGERAVWVAASLPRHIPLVAIGHGTEFGLKSSWERALTRWSFERADLVVCVSQFTQNFMLAQHIQPRHLATIPNGADDAQFRRLPESEIAAFRRQGVFGAGPLLLSVGQVNERKGQHVVIRAMPKVLERFPDVHYLMAGLPTDRAKLSALARELGVGDHVHFLGKVDPTTLVKLLNLCDLFVMTSYHTRSGDFEGYGIAVIEAALCGKPAVVTGDSGLAEAIVPGETGLLVPQNDPSQTADAILTLLSDTARRIQMGAAAQSRALAEQTWAKRAAIYQQQFESLLAP